MKFSEFTFSTFNNKLCNFTFKDRTTGTGVITTFLIEDTNTLYFLMASLIQEYKKHEAEKNWVKIKNLLIRIYPEDILIAELVEDNSNLFSNTHKDQMS